MQKLSCLTIAGLCVLSLAIVSPPARADVQSDLVRLEKLINEQGKLIEQQRTLLKAQAKEINDQKKRLDSVAQAAPTKKVASASAYEPRKVPSDATPPAASYGYYDEEENARPQVYALANQGGILSRPGSLTFENTIEYTNTTRNLFAFNGVELAQVVLVGGITATSARHQIVQETGRLRLGLTDRLEADIHVPFVYRNDNLTNTVTATGATQTTSLEGANIGDIDLGLAYQMNDGKQGRPFLIGNLRYKANNADGPFDVPYDANNVATRLPTGSGFQTVEASLTAIKVSDPAVLYTNVGYVYDVPRDINRDFNGVTIGHVNPGDAVNALIGMGFSINQDTSFSLGYKHSYVFPTYQKTTQGGVTTNASSGTSQVGALTFGMSHAFTPTTTVNFNIEAGVTNDAPDVHLIFRVPIHLGNLF